MGGSAAAYHARHRDSFDHDLPDLTQRFDVVLAAIEETDGWVTNRLAPGKLILGELGDIEPGVRQLIRRRPLEVEEVALPSGRRVRVPTVDETLRVKAFLIVRRNQTRDFLDVAALAVSQPYGTAVLLQRAVGRARAEAAASERAEVARRVRTWIDASGLGRAAFAEAIGTSPSRLSTT